MRSKLAFLAGAAVGYVLGSKAGRARYEEIKAKARTVLEDDRVQDAMGTAREKASEVVGAAGSAARAKVGEVASEAGTAIKERVGGVLHKDDDPPAPGSGPAPVAPPRAP